MNKHEFTNSSSLSHCDYNDKENELIIKFASGKTYTYPDVPKHEYEALKKAASAGTHFHQFIRNKYKHKE